MQTKEMRIRTLQFNLLMALAVWSCWYGFGGEFAVASIIKNWPVALTMVFGALVGGGTSEGGGAVAFPVFTKILHIPPNEARLFALGIQSIGMTAASLSILFMRARIEWRVLPYAGIAGIIGIVFSTYCVVPLVSPPLVKIAFTIMVSSLAIALLLMNRGDKSARHERLPVFGTREKCMIVAAGLVGGVMSGLVGCGENIATFMVMVLLFRLSEKVATPTTVILMTMVTLAGFFLHIFGVGDFTPTVQGYWLAGVPVAVVFAPLGAFICAMMSKRMIANVLIFLISLEFLSTVFIIPMSPAVMMTAAATLAAFGLLNWYMCRVDIYAPKAKRDDMPDALPQMA